MRNKYYAKKVTVDGHTFDSKHEAERYSELKLLERAGQIENLQLQVPFVLLPLQKGEDGKTLERGVKYVADGKNFNAHRTLTLTSLAMKEIQEQRDMLRTAGIVSPWVFPTSRGGHIMQNKLRTYWYEYCDKMGICRRTTKYGEERYITPYEFRHTCYSVDKDMPDTLKKMAFGHSRSFDGGRVYNHEMDGDRERIAEYSQAAFIQILCPQE